MTIQKRNIFCKFTKKNGLQVDLQTDIVKFTLREQCGDVRRGLLAAKFFVAERRTTVNCFLLSCSKSFECSGAFA